MKTLVKEIKARKKTRRKWNKIIGVLLFTTVIGTLITLSALRQPPPIPKKPANEYFSFSDVIALGESNNPQNTSIFIEYVVFNITAVGGNASEVEIRPLEGLVTPDNYPRFDSLTFNVSTPLEDLLRYPQKVLSSKQESGWPLRFYISSKEAEGPVTVYVSKFLPFLSS